MIPKYERPVAPIAQTYLGAAQINESASADISWKNFFCDERLKTLVELALANNRDFRVAMLNVERSRAEYRITKSASYPTVDGGGSFTRQHSANGTANQWSASLGLTAYELDLSGRVRSLNEQALEKYFATVEARRAAQISLVAEVASQYFALRQAEEQLGLARQTLASVLEAHKINQATFDAGAGNALDFRTSEGQVQSARITVTTYERQVAQAKNYLVLLVGQSVSADLPAALALNDGKAVAEIPSGLPSELVQRRPDILEAEHMLKAANANISAARAAFFPRISLTGSAGTGSDAFSKLFGAGTGVWSFSPQITVPIFSGGQLRAELDVAKISASIEVANYEKAIQTAFREVSDALVATGSFATQIEEQAALIVTQQSRFDLATARYRQGADNYLNVLSAQQDLYNAQRNHIDAQYSRITSQIALYKALGGGWK